MKPEFYRFKSFLCLDGPAKTGSGEAEPKDGMFLGRCFFTTKEKAGEIWAKYKSHPRLMVNLQDDDFAAQFRKSSGNRLSILQEQK